MFDHHKPLKIKTSKCHNRYNEFRYFLNKIKFMMKNQNENLHYIKYNTNFHFVYLSLYFQFSLNNSSIYSIDCDMLIFQLANIHE